MTRSIEELPTGTEQIICVDDEEEMVRLTHKKLELLGYRVESATDPKKALKIFQSNPHKVDLIITDMIMPGMTGAKLAEEVLKIRPDIPVILCSGYSKLSRESARKIGIRRYMQKPIELSQLACSVRQVIDGE